VTVALAAVAVPALIAVLVAQEVRGAYRPGTESSRLRRFELPLLALGVGLCFLRLFQIV
jgi:hypothetical protein